jgi:hypothetical protein
MKWLVAVMMIPLVLSATAHAGKLYIWTDKEGIINITDKPPEPGEEAVEIKGRSGSKKRSVSAEIEKLQNTAALDRLNLKYEFQDMERRRNIRTETIDRDYENALEEIYERQRHAEIEKARE